MLAEERDSRQGRLEENIRELSRKVLNDEEIRNISLKLLDIYKGDFRHSHSSFFPIMEGISRDAKLSLDCLTDNLENIKAYVEKDFVSGEKEFESIYAPLDKLRDHINVEIGHLNYYSKYTQMIEDVKSQMDSLNTNMSDATQKMDEIKIETKSLNSDMSKATKNLKKATKKADSIQTELIAVLSIFAAIVVTFSGGFTFLGSVMSSVNGVEYFETVVLEAIVCGMVIFNTIFLLMYMVGKITDRNIYAKCNAEECPCENNCGSLTRIQKRLPYVFWLNVICIIGILLDCIIWYIDMMDWFGL